MEKNRKKLIVIHGNGGNFADALSTLETILEVPVGWADGQFYIAKPFGLAIRRLITETEPSSLVRTVQKLAIARLLFACFENNPVNPEHAISYSESRLIRDHVDLGIPLGPAARRRRASQLQQEAMSELAAIRPVLDHLQTILCAPDGSRPAERVAALLIEQAGGSDLLDSLIYLRSLPETGGDLDTVASAVFYLHGLSAEHEASHGEPLVYGRDCQIVYVNYHEPFLHLAQYAPADIYMADLPIGALPCFERDIVELADQDVRAITYEDHHPYTQEQIDMLHGLRERGLLELVSMSGPLVGEELAEGEEKCASEMVYQRLIENQSFDNPAMAYLSEITHAEDLATPDRQPLGRQLTELIKGGVCKVDLAQRLTLCQNRDDLTAMMYVSGWEQDVESWREQFEQISDQLWHQVVRVKLERKGNPAETGGTARGIGSDLSVSRLSTTAASNEINLLFVHAYRPPKGDPKVGVGRVTEYFARECPDVDYFFYCYGSSLCVTRRLNQADFELNLGDLMPKLGSTGDGGHAGAAVCKPESNKHYPHTLLRDVSGGQFITFVRYLADRIATVTEREVISVIDESMPMDKQDQRGNALKLILVSAAAILIGAGLASLHPRFERQSIVESNLDFFRQLNTQITASDLTDPDAPIGSPDSEDDDAATSDVQIFQAP